MELALALCIGALVGAVVAFICLEQYLRKSLDNTHQHYESQLEELLENAYQCGREDEAAALTDPDVLESLYDDVVLHLND